MSGELELLKWIRSRTKARGGAIYVDTGDDAAVVKFGRERVLLKTDSVVEGVHFLPDAQPESIGHKALARPLSDIAAMGGVPIAAVAAAILPRGWPMEKAKRLQRGMDGLAVPIVGGDIVTHKGPLCMTVSVIGDLVGVEPVLRSGARPGDAILVTGPLGGSMGGKHLTFLPRMAEGRLFATRRFRVHAMIDISDGLARDLGHVCEASGTGAELDAERIPITRGSNLAGALYDGEDYELLAAADPKTASLIEKARKGVIIGRMTSKPGLWIAGRKIEPKGYEHPLS